MRVGQKSKRGGSQSAGFLEPNKQAEKVKKCNLRVCTSDDYIRPIDSKKAVIIVICEGKKVDQKRVPHPLSKNNCARLFEGSLTEREKYFFQKYRFGR